MYKGWRIFKWVLLGLVFITLIGYVTMSLWNWLVPALFAGPVLTFWQALGLLVLAKIIFWGAGGKRHHGGGPYWKHRMHEKFSKMTPEEREAFRNRLRDRWCHHGEHHQYPEPEK